MASNETTRSQGGDITEIRWKDGSLEKIREGDHARSELWALSVRGHAFYLSVEPGDWPQLLITEIE